MSSYGKQLKYNISCEGHLERAANSNSIILAKQELEIAIDYIETNNLTTGNTSFFFKTTPSNDIEFWYNNLNSAYAELEELSVVNLSPLETSNVLMKLRETILKRDSVIAPSEIYYYPNRWAWKITISLWPFFMIFYILLWIVVHFLYRDR